MNPEKQRIAIAEACGWSLVPNYAKTGLYGYHNHQPSYDVAECPPGAIPDYTTDLNAIHEAERAMSWLRRSWYVRELTEITSLQEECETSEEIDWAFAHATAAQRAEAFLRTINRWEDAP